jgi:hypothetical protein
MVDDSKTLFFSTGEGEEKIGKIYRDGISFIQCAKPTIEEVVNCLTEKGGSQDIIMLDYLLGNISGTNRRDYGHKFIKLISDIFKNKPNEKDNEWLRSLCKSYNLFKDEIKQEPLDPLVNSVNESPQKKEGGDASKSISEVVSKFSTFQLNKAPFNRFWVFPISVHNTALLETLKAEGIQFNNPNWFISRGGDPVNTPYLFLYNLLKLMELQVAQAYLEASELKAHLNQFERSISASKSWSDVEGKARVAVNGFMYRFGAFEMLDLDEGKGSLLATSLKKSNASNNIFLYNSIRNFLYLLGYRSYRNLLELLNAAETISTALLRNEDELAKKENPVKKLIETIREKYLQEA